MKNIKCSIEDIKAAILEDYNEDEFAIAKVGFMSTRPNSHKLVIPEEVLKKNASSVLGKWVVAKMNFMGTDAKGHDPDEQIVGMFPTNQTIEFKEDEDGYLHAYAMAVISKIYAEDYCKMFVDDNERSVSIEMTCYTEHDNETNDVVESFNVVGVTTLGKNIDPSIPESNVTFVRFSKDEANEYFNKFSSENFVNHPISTDKKDIYEGEWDGQKAKQDLVKEEKFKSLAPKVCMKLEDGWEDREITKLGYPVMTLYDGKWVYSAKGIASALGYAKKENETAVVNKIEKIYKKLDLNENNGKEDKKEMSNVEMSVVNIGEMWRTLSTAIRERREWNYYIRDIYEEDNKKFAILANDDDICLYRLDFDYTEDGVTLADEVIEVKPEFVETGKIVKFSRPENCEGFPKDECSEPDNIEMSIDELKAKLSELEAEIEKRDNIIMEKDNACKEKDVELECLRAFKTACMEAERGAKVESVMNDVCKYMSKEQAEDCRKEGFSCDFSAIDAWANKVKASVFEKMAKKVETDSEFTRMSAPISNETKKVGSVWDRL